MNILSAITVALSFGLGGRRVAPAVLAPLALLFALSAAATDEVVDVSLNSETLRVGFVQTLSNGWTQWDLAWAHHQDDGDALSLGLHSTGPIGSVKAQDRGARLGLGGKLAYYNLSGQDGASLALGGFVRVPLPSRPRLVVGAHAYFAPGALSVIDGESYKEFGIDASYRILPRFELYLAGRSTRGRFESSPAARVEQGLLAGFRARF